MELSHDDTRARQPVHLEKLLPASGDDDIGLLSQDEGGEPLHVAAHQQRNPVIDIQVDVPDTGRQGEEDRTSFLVVRHQQDLAAIALRQGIRLGRQDAFHAAGLVQRVNQVDDFHAA